MPGILGAIGEGVGLVGDIVNFASSIENQKYQREQQDITRQREDTAVQRRVKDLEAAGLSPTLAAGGAASTSAPINVSAPQFSGVNAMRAVEYNTAKKQNALTDAQLDLVNTQTDAANANSFISRAVRDEIQKEGMRGYDKPEGTKGYSLITSTIDKMIADNKKSVLDTAIAGYNSLIAQSQGLPVTAGSLDALGQGKIIDNALSNPGAAVSPLAGVIKTIAQIFK